MSQYYNSKRSKNLFDPKATEPFKLSRSKIDLFLECPRCFYLDRRLGIGRPPSFPFNLNSAVDTLLKKEFDIHRANGSAHPMMKTYGLDAVPYRHDKIEEWRDALRRGITFLHKPTNLIITGGVDDVWVNPQGELRCRVQPRRIRPFVGGFDQTVVYERAVLFLNAQKIVTDQAGRLQMLGLARRPVKPRAAPGELVR